MIEHSEQITELTKALVIAQTHLGGVVKDAKNPHFKSQYATLGAVMLEARPALNTAGIALSQAPGRLRDGLIEITTTLLHGESGQWMSSTLEVPVAKRDPQGVGSAITYGLRYSLQAMLGIPSIDDDGEAAMDRDAAPAAAIAPPKPASKADARVTYDRLAKANREIKTSDEFNKFWTNAKVIQAFKTLPEDWQGHLYAERDDKSLELDETEAAQTVERSLEGVN